MDLLVRCSRRRIYFIHHNPVRPSVPLVLSFLHNVVRSYIYINNTHECTEFYVKFKITSVTCLNFQLMKLFLNYYEL